MPKLFVVDDLKCPTCGNGESHPDGDKVLIRGMKVHQGGSWWSQCLVCAGYYNPITLRENPPTKELDSRGYPKPKGFDEAKGWFRS